MKLVLKCTLIVCLAVGMSYGWGGPSHGSIANRMIENADINYALSARGLSPSTIASNSQSEPPDAVHHPGWERLNTQANLNAYWMVNSLDNTWAGYLMHIVCDCGVPVSHSPASEIWSSDCAETYFEAQAVAYGTPAWPAPYYSSRTSPGYDTYVEAFRQDQRYWAQRFKDHHNKKWNCKYLCACQTDWIDPYCRENALQLGWEVLWWYGNYHP